MQISRKILTREHLILMEDSIKIFNSNFIVTDLVTIRQKLQKNLIISDGMVDLAWQRVFFFVSKQRGPN